MNAPTRTPLPDGMEFVEAPPAMRRGGGLLDRYADHLAVLRTRPNAWARIDQREKPASAASTANGLKKQLDAKKYEVRSADGGIYVRYIGAN